MPDGFTTSITFRRDVASAVERWKPDPVCIEAGDRLVDQAWVAWAGSLSDRQIRQRLRDAAGDPINAPLEFARHCARSGVSYSRTIELESKLALIVPGWVDDPEAIVAIVDAAFDEEADQS